MRHLRLAVFTFALMICGAPAFAGAGLHFGMTVDPDDFLIGLHFKGRTTPVRLVPSVEAGVGDVTMIAGNLDLHFVPRSRSDVVPYVGGGLTINWFDYGGGSDTDFGGSVLGGATLNSKYFMEAKVGLGNVPTLKFCLGARLP